MRPAIGRGVKKTTKLDDSQTQSLRQEVLDLADLQPLESSKALICDSEVKSELVTGGLGLRIVQSR